MSHKLTRRELYDLVWSMPMIKLAPRFGMSDVALRKRCHAHEIPTPAAGYWAQVAAGQEPEVAELPPADSRLEHIYFDRGPTSPVAKPPIPLVDVPIKLNEPHPAVTWLDNTLKTKPHHGPWFRIGGTYDPVAFLTESSLDRALRVLNALFRALEHRGHVVEARPRGGHWTETEMLVTAFGEQVALRVEEKVARKPHVLTREELKEKAAQEERGWGTGRVPEFDYYPSGELKVSIGLTHHNYTGRKSGADTKTKRLDEQLGHLLLAIEAACILGRDERIEAERREQERRDVERKRLRVERLRWYRRKLEKDFEGMAASWRKARELREFLAAYATALPPAKRNDVAEAWFKAVTRYTEQVDPLSDPESLAQGLEPSDEVLEQLVGERRPNNQ